MHIRNEVKLLVVSHYTANKGTTDFFLDYLYRHKIEHYYLKHPLPNSGFKRSELVYFNGDENFQLRTYQLTSIFPIDMLIQIFVTFRVSHNLKHKKQINYLIAFGAINAFAPIILLKRSLCIAFWGVDYTKQRFSSRLLNGMYYLFETVACRWSNLVIQPTARQALERQKRHGLSVSRTLIAPNGVELCDISRSKQILYHETTALLYIGTLSPFHGVHDFIMKEMIDRRDMKLIIFGNGEEYEAIRATIKLNELNNITLLGNREQSYISNYLQNCESRLIGIAPYKRGGHVDFGDSLKIKEYVNYGLTFISSDAVSIQSELKCFGYIYSDKINIDEALQVSMNFQTREQALKKLSWEYIISNSVMPSLIC